MHLRVRTDAEGVATFVRSVIDTDLPPPNGMMHQSACRMPAQVTDFVKPAWLGFCFDMLSNGDDDDDDDVCLCSTETTKKGTNPIVRHVLQ